MNENLIKFHSATEVVFLIKICNLRKHMLSYYLALKGLIDL